MSQIEKKLITLLKEKIPKNISATEEIASVLGINYDAAYRRLNGKVSFSILEAIKLSKKFDVSLNELYEIGETNSYLVRETKTIATISDFNDYLIDMLAELRPLVGRDDASILFSAREFPMYYFFHNPLLIRIKIFIWFNILKVATLNKPIAFKDFVIPDEIIENTKKVGYAYERINVTEMWSFGAINNVLQQIIYLHKMNQIDYEDAEKICDALIDELKKIEYTTHNGNNPKTRKFEIYSNEIIMMNNSMILKLKDKMVFGYPYALLKFFVIENQKACKEQEAYIKKQMQHAICVTNTSTKEHVAFFNHKYQKIQQALAVMRNEENKPLFL